MATFVKMLPTDGSQVHFEAMIHLKLPGNGIYDSLFCCSCPLTSVEIGVTILTITSLMLLI